MHSVPTAGTNAIVQGVGAGVVSEAKDRPSVARLGEGAVQVGDAATDYKCPHCLRDFSLVPKESRNGSMAKHIKKFCPAARGVADGEAVNSIHSHFEFDVPIVRPILILSPLSGAAEGAARSLITAGNPRLKGKELVASPATDIIRVPLSKGSAEGSAEVLGDALRPEKEGPKKKKLCSRPTADGKGGRSDEVEDTDSGIECKENYIKRGMTQWKHNTEKWWLEARYKNTGNWYLCRIVDQIASTRGPRYTISWKDGDKKDTTKKLKDLRKPEATVASGWDCKDGKYKKCNYSGTDCREVRWMLLWYCHAVLCVMMICRVICYN